MRVLSLNAGLLRAFGGVLQPAPFVEERLAELPRQLRALNPDVVALQEVYEHAHQDKIIEQLSDLYPHIGRVIHRTLGSLDSGLLLLSKRRLSVTFDSFRFGPRIELWLARKGVLVGQLHWEDGSTLTIGNVHTTAGALAHPERPWVDLLRQRQIEQVFAALESQSAHTDAVIVMGDFNAGPGVSPMNYRAFADRGYVDVHEFLNPQSTDCTWDPSNELNRDGPHRSSPPQRIDHVFVSQRAIERGVVRPRSSEVVLREPVVVVPGNRRVTVSDHYGVIAELDIVGPR